MAGVVRPLEPKCVGVRQFIRVARCVVNLEPPTYGPILLAATPQRAVQRWPNWGARRNALCF